PLLSQSGDAKRLPEEPPTKRNSRAAIRGSAPAPAPVPFEALCNVESPQQGDSRPILLAPNPHTTNKTKSSETRGSLAVPRSNGWFRLPQHSESPSREFSEKQRTSLNLISVTEYRIPSPCVCAQTRRLPSGPCHYATAAMVRSTKKSARPLPRHASGL